MGLSLYVADYNRLRRKRDLPSAGRISLSCDVNARRIIPGGGLGLLDAMLLDAMLLDATLPDATLPDAMLPDATLLNAELAAAELNALPPPALPYFLRLIGGGCKGLGLAGGVTVPLFLSESNSFRISWAMLSRL